MSFRALSQAAGKIDRDHRAMEGDHRTLIDQGIEEKGRVGKAEKNLGMSRDCGEIDKRQQPPASIAATCAKNRLDVVIREKGIDLGRARIVITCQDSRAI